MKRSRSAVCFFIALVLPALCGLASVTKLRTDGPRHRVPYRLSETLHVVVRAKFNGKGPFNFIVDTGAPAMFVTTDVAKKVGIEPTPDGWATFERMEIEGGATLKDVKGRVEDIFQIKGMNGLGLPGVRLDGVLGYNILAKFRMEFDLSKTSMIWTELDFDPPLPKPLGEGGGSTPPELQAIGGLMQFAGAIMGRGEPEVATPRGFLGIELADADGTVQIKSVLPQSPADLAGLKPGDTLGQFAGKPVTSPADVLKLASSIGADEGVLIVVKRGAEKLELTAKTGKGM